MEIGCNSFKLNETMHSGCRMQWKGTLATAKEASRLAVAKSSVESPLGEGYPRICVSENKQGAMLISTVQYRY